MTITVPLVITVLAMIYAVVCARQARRNQRDAERNLAEATAQNERATRYAEAAVVALERAEEAARRSQTFAAGLLTHGPPTRGSEAYRASEAVTQMIKKVRPDE